MCISKKVSLISFLLFNVSSYLLIKNIKTPSSLVIGIFFMYVSLMQVVDYFIWDDLDCTKGFNKIISAIAPIILHLQPIILLSLIKYFLKPKNKLFNQLFYPIVISYTSYTIYKYIEYLKSEPLCTSIHPKTGHLLWKWTYHFNYLLYNLLFFLVFLFFYKNKIISTALIYSYIVLTLSYFKFKEQMAELWCFLNSIVPFLVLLTGNLKL